ncbi:MAG: GlsB/YeaQ/YmgE family stress response membrane protein [Hyphomicrobium sp.]
MGFFAWIFVGLIAGWIAEQIAGREHGLVTNLVVGVIGALLGGFVFGSLLGFRYDEGFNLATIAVATLGSVLLLWIVGAMRSRGTIQ